MYVVRTLIMAGGIGERLWPVSVKKRPKQFHKFGSFNAVLFTALPGRERNL